MRADQRSPSVYVFDAPITEAKTIKILVCDTQSLGQSNIETLINSIKSQDSAPIVYIFFEVNPATLASINTCFQDQSHWIFEQAYPESENKSDDTKLVTLFNRSVMRRDKPRKVAIGCNGQLVQSFLCMLANSSTDFSGSSFVLHAAHLNLDNQHRIRDVEETIRTKILNNYVSETCPQILAGDLGIPTLAGDSWSPRIAALTYVPSARIFSSYSFQGKQVKMPITDREVGVTPFQQIDSASAQPPGTNVKSGQPAEMQNSSQLVLLSRFGGKYLKMTHGMEDVIYPGKYSGYLEATINRHLENALVFPYCSDLIGGQLACMPGENPLRYYLVLEIPKKLWGKLCAFIDTTDMVVQEGQGDYLLSMRAPSPKGHNQMVASFKNAVESLSKFSLLEFESHISGLYVKLIKQPDNSVCFKFSAESDNGAQPSLVATQLAAINALHKLDANSDSLLKNLLSTAAIVNKKFSSLITASFLCQAEANNVSYLLKLEFVNLAIASFVRSSGWIYFSGGRYTTKPLDQHSYYKDVFLQKDGSLVLPINMISGELQVGEDYLSHILSKRAEEIDGYLPFTIYSHDEAENSFTVEKLLPYALVQRLSLGKPTKGDTLFSYPYERSLVDIVGGLFQDRFNLEAAIVHHFQSYKGTDQAYLELEKVSQKRGNDVVAACQDMVEHCSKKIKLSESSTNILSIFSASENDKRTALLRQSIKNIKANFVFNCQSKDNIQTLQQLINTQEKRVLVELCKLERKSADGEPYNKFQKNSALLLLENHLILSHPAHMANDVWKHIKAEPVERYGTEKNYLNESGDKELTLGEILSQVPEIQKVLSSLVTANDVVLQAEVLRK